MSRETLWRTVQMAWTMLSGSGHEDVRAGRDRRGRPAQRGDEPPLAKEGFAEEALPWLGAVYRFSLRLTQGDEATAEDLAQETFLRAYRSWHRYERGTNVKSWLFTICRNTHLHEAKRARSRNETPVADLDERAEALSAAAAFERASPTPEREMFDGLIDDEVVDAIDALPGEFREVLVLSDLGDLEYAEIARVLDIPIGTVKSRLFRARRLVQERIREYAVRSGYIPEGTR